LISPFIRHYFICRFFRHTPRRAMILLPMPRRDIDLFCCALLLRHIIFHYCPAATAFRHAIRAAPPTPADARLCLPAIA